ncbi:murein transglycosylase A [Oricola sp.]|uniref:murein transglycosylase A n=1 Tax=Oricola sp. TaxID=1979950 RepID=UPI003BA9E0BA
MWSLRPVGFEDLPGWAADDHRAAVCAFARHAGTVGNKPYRTGAIGIEPGDLQPLHIAAGKTAARNDPRRFLEEEFQPLALLPEAGKPGLVTAFYEPEIEASPVRDCRYTTPIHRRPPDLVAVDDSNRPSAWGKDVRFGQIGAGGSISPYPDRRAINNGCLDGRGLEIAWVEDAVDAFFAHIQGAARLKMTDGSIVRITYDGKSGHPFTPIGRLLVERGEIASHAVGMQTIRSWLAKNLDRARALMEENRSYIFFRVEPVDDPDDGPIAAAKVPLTAGRSLAVDRLIHTYGTPVFVHAGKVGGADWSRLMIAQDTGSAIVGPARGDLFMGSGDRAGEAASDVCSAADFYLLAPKASAIAVAAGMSP